MADIEKRPYWESVETFLRELQDLHVTSLCLVALSDDKEIHNCVVDYDAGPFELMTMAGILQLRANMLYLEANNAEDDEDEEDEDNEDDN